MSSFTWIHYISITIPLFLYLIILGISTYNLTHRAACDWSTLLDTSTHRLLSSIQCSPASHLSQSLLSNWLPVYCDPWKHKINKRYSKYYNWTNVLLSRYPLHERSRIIFRYNLYTSRLHNKKMLTNCLFVCVFLEEPINERWN